MSPLAKLERAFRAFVLGATLSAGAHAFDQEIVVRFDAPPDAMPDLVCLHVDKVDPAIAVRARAADTAEQWGACHYTKPKKAGLQTVCVARGAPVVPLDPPGNRSKPKAEPTLEPLVLPVLTAPLLPSARQLDLQIEHARLKSVEMDAALVRILLDVSEVRTFTPRVEVMGGGYHHGLVKAVQRDTVVELGLVPRCVRRRFDFPGAPVGACQEAPSCRREQYREIAAAVQKGGAEAASRNRLCGFEATCSEGWLVTNELGGKSPVELDHESALYVGAFEHPPPGVVRVAPRCLSFKWRKSCFLDGLGTVRDCPSATLSRYGSRCKPTRCVPRNDRRCCYQCLAASPIEFPTTVAFSVAPERTAPKSQRAPCGGEPLACAGDRSVCSGESEPCHEGELLCSDGGTYCRHGLPACKLSEAYCEPLPEALSCEQALRAPPSVPGDAARKLSAEEEASELVWETELNHPGEELGGFVDPEQRRVFLRWPQGVTVHDWETPGLEVDYVEIVTPDGRAQRANIDTPALAVPGAQCHDRVSYQYYGRYPHRARSVALAGDTVVLEEPEVDRQKVIIGLRTHAGAVGYFTPDPNHRWKPLIDAELAALLREFGATYELTLSGLFSLHPSSSDFAHDPRTWEFVPLARVLFGAGFSRHLSQRFLWGVGVAGGGAFPMLAEDWQIAPPYPVAAARLRVGYEVTRAVGFEFNTWLLFHERFQETELDAFGPAGITERASAAVCAAAGISWADVF